MGLRFMTCFSEAISTLTTLRAVKAINGGCASQNYWLDATLRSPKALERKLKLRNKEYSVKANLPARSRCLFNLV